MGDSHPPGYSVKKVYKEGEEGSRTDAVLYSNDTTGALILAYRGTTPTWNDWWNANGANAFGIEAPKYRGAVDLALDVQNDNAGLSITLTGHSLGGGEAALASMATGLTAITFNAAGVDPKQYDITGGDQARITNFKLLWEPLSTSQDIIKPILFSHPLSFGLHEPPDALGHQVYLEAKTRPVSGDAYNHGMSSVLIALGAAPPISTLPKEFVPTARQQSLQSVDGLQWTDYQDLMGGH
jgi:fermentation-respiration switch protein FrsA (DUF1100 family)